MTKIIEKKWIIIVTPLFFYIFLLGNGFLGINFGRHWDEWIFIAYVDEFFHSGRLLPGQYIYPSFCYYLSLLAGYIFQLLHSSQPNIPFLENNEYKLFLRGIFVSIASLSVIWTYFLALKITNKYRVAFFAGLIFCSSFEFSYHSRWAVTDLIATQFACLSTLILFLDMNITNRALLSAFVAGIAAGTKYTAGIVLINIVIMLIVNRLRNSNCKTSTKLTSDLLIVFTFFVLAFMLTTPGSIIESKNFFSDLVWQKNVYAGGHYGYTIKPGLAHFTKMSLYIIFNIFSKQSFASTGIAFLGLLGAYFSFIKREWNVFGLFLVMALYIGFLSVFRVMVVRNVMYVLPYFTVLAAYGLYSLHSVIHDRKVIIAAEALFLLMLAISLQAVVMSSFSIFRKDSIDVKKELVAFLSKNDEKSFVFSEQVERLLSQKDKGQVTADSYLMFFKDEVHWENYQSNELNLYQTIAGPSDVNFNYYPTWIGQNRIIVMKFKDANARIRNDLKLPIKRLTVSDEV